MSNLLSIDPGTRAVGFAVFEESELVWTRASIAPKAARSLGELIAHHSSIVKPWGSGRDVAVEVMHWRPNDPASQPQDLLHVQAVGMALAGRMGAEITCYRFQDWKGSIPKRVHHKRIMGALTGQELEVLSYHIDRTPLRNRKEVMDAVGVGLFHLERINRAGTCK